MDLIVGEHDPDLDGQLSDELDAVNAARTTGVPGARGLEHHLVFGRAELADLLVGVRVGAAHEPVPDHADAKLLLGH